MTLNEMKDRFAPAIEEMINSCRITDEFIDKERFQVLIATIWGNAVLDPARTGIEEADLSNLHDLLNEQLSQLLGTGASVTSCYEFIMSKSGEDSLKRQEVSSRHREFLHYFAGLILSQAPGK